MWQRVQTAYLLIAVIAGALQFVFDFGSFSLGDRELEYGILGIVDNTGELLERPWAVLIPGILTMLVTVVALVLFGNRINQMRVLKLNFLLLTGYFALVVYYMDVASQLLSESGEAEMSYGIGLGMPVLMLIFTFLANKAIKKDENLVRSVDRLR